MLIGMEPPLKYFRFGDRRGFGGEAPRLMAASTDKQRRKRD